MIQASIEELLMLIGEMKIREFKLSNENIGLKRELDRLKIEQSKSKVEEE